MGEKADGKEGRREERRGEAEIEEEDADEISGKHGW